MIDSRHSSIQRPPRRPSMGAAGFSMVEILLAAMILAVGFMMLLPAFTTGIKESRNAIDNSVGVQVAQSAVACCQGLLSTNDPNWSANPLVPNPKDGSIHPYQFNLGSPGMNDAIWSEVDLDGKTHYYSIRVHGDATKSRIYWNLLFRIRSTEPNLVELWVMVCKRGGTDPSTPGANPSLLQLPNSNPATVSVSGAAGSAAIGGSPVQPSDTSFVTSTGEVLNVSPHAAGANAVADTRVTTGFGGGFIVPWSAANTANTCIYAVHTKKAF